MYFSTAYEWFTWISSHHPTEIELGLDRVKSVAKELRLLTPSVPVITVAGTNGKGSTVAALEAIYTAAGYRVGAFTSPFLFKHNEQVRLNGELASDESLCAAFEKIEKARGEISLTAFEFFTLAALCIFHQQMLDVLILEVGLGGRLDAVNIIDADVAVVTSIDIDHVNWLGKTREEIAREKAGIFRKHKPAVYGDHYPPETLIEYAATLSTPVFYQGKNFQYRENKSDWSWSHEHIHYEHLPRNSLLTQNMSIALMVVTLLQQRLPVTRAAIDQGLAMVKLPGRIQIITSAVTKIFDVSHNPAAIALLAKRLQELPCTGRTLAVFSMLADKDITASVAAISNEIDIWHVAPLAGSRAASEALLAAALKQVPSVVFHLTISAAYQSALQTAKPGDRIVVFGSFHTVAAASL